MARKKDSKGQNFKSKTMYGGKSKSCLKKTQKYNVGMYQLRETEIIFFDIR